ncbi:Bacteriophytochrome [Burkholderia sp. AD24]|nr:Bacteriophytochrome [Burkholderia sp. AD24]
MRLADFILRDMEMILIHWEAFASTRLPAAADMKSPALRDNAEQLLQAIARDLSTAQTREAQIEKSLGLAPPMSGASETAAQTLALLRARGGFDINQVAAEYRALRASVLRLWMDDCHPDVPHPDDAIRFNEAIDQALSESLGYFTSQVDQARNLFLGMLGHDMRSPLQTILMTAQYLTALNAGDQVSVAASRLIRSGARMQALLSDMLDFNRTRLGLSINISPAETDLGKLFAEELDQLRAAHPDRHVELDVQGECRGVWDGRRLQQLLGNLILNAFKYGAPDAPVRVFMTGEEQNIRFEVRNQGPAIDRVTLNRIFDPLQRGLDGGDSSNTDGNLGLGLYIAREISKAHGGEIDAGSNAGQTVFMVRLPRSPRNH